MFEKNIFEKKGEEYNKEANSINIITGLSKLGVVNFNIRKIGKHISNDEYFGIMDIKSIDDWEKPKYLLYDCCCIKTVYYDSKMKKSYKKNFYFEKGSGKFIQQDFEF